MGVPDVLEPEFSQNRQDSPKSELLLIIGGHGSPQFAAESHFCGAFDLLNDLLCQLNDRLELVSFKLSIGISLYSDWILRPLRGSD